MSFNSTDVDHPLYYDRSMTFRTLPALMLATLLVLLTGCDGLLDTEPQQSVDTTVGTSSPEGIRALYHSTYNRLTGSSYYGQRLMMAGDVLADNAVGHPTTSGRYVSEPQNQLGTGVGGWGRYTQINEINYALKYASTVDGMPDAERTRIQGEMHFLRALAYHDLMKVYAYEPNQIVDGFDLGVIIRTEPTETVDQADFRPRATVQDVYDLIEADLLEAISLLSQEDRGNPFFGTLAAAEALLARVYLYAENWSGAETYATRAMDNSSARLATPDEVATMFNNASDPTVESIFEVRFRQTEGLGVNNSISSLLTPPGHYDVLPSAELLAIIAEEDTRSALYPFDEDLEEYESDATGHTMVNKFNQSVATYTDNIPVLRYAEMLLTRAEARAEQPGSEADALADLNLLRENRGLEAFDAMPADLIGEILEERRRELAFEGHRWHDMKRRGMDIEKPAELNLPTLEYGVPQTLARIPTGEVSLNADLVQNPGY